MLRKLASPTWAILEYGWYPLLLFLATPWFLHQLGTELYGHWMLLTATVAFGGVLNGGTGAATIKAISAGIGRNSIGNSECTVNASLAIAIVGGGVLATAVFSIFWFGASPLLSRMGEPALVRLTGTTAAAVIWLEQLDNVFSSAMKGAEHFGQAARVEIASKTIQVIAVALVLIVSPTPRALYVTLLVVAILRLLTKSVVTRRLLGLEKFRPSFTHVMEILHFAKWGWVQGVGGVMFGAADRMLVGSLLGAASLSYYSIASQLAMQIHTATAAGLSVIFPILSRKLEAQDHFSLPRVAKFTISGNLAFCSSLAIVLWHFGPELVIFWLGRAQSGPVIEILPYLVLAYWLLAMNVTPHYMLLSLGRIRYVAISNLVAGFVLTVGVAMIALPYGVVGVSVARVFYGVLILVNFIPLVDRLRQAGRS